MQQATKVLNKLNGVTNIFAKYTSFASFIILMKNINKIIKNTFIRHILIYGSLYKNDIGIYLTD